MTYTNTLGKIRSVYTEKVPMPLCEKLALPVPLTLPLVTDARENVSRAAQMRLSSIISDLPTPCILMMIKS